MEEYREEEQVEDYPVTVFLSREGYFKKITPQSLRMSGEQKYKEGDGPGQQAEATNRRRAACSSPTGSQVYKTRLSEFEDSKASGAGRLSAGQAGHGRGRERGIYGLLPGDYSGHLLFFFENGKVARVEMKAYATVSNRRKLTGAYSDKTPAGGHSAAGGGSGAGAAVHEARCADLPHRPCCCPRPPAPRRAWRS